MSSVCLVYGFTSQGMLEGTKQSGKDIYAAVQAVICDTS